MTMANIPKIYQDVPNWWYHYYSRGVDRRIKKLSREHFLLHPNKATPDFENFIYNYGICHPQIGESVVPTKSIVVLKTTVGLKNAPAGFLEKAQFIVGYFRVFEVDRKNKIIVMDRKDSLLLLDNPIKIDVEWAKKLFPEKRDEYWQPISSLVRKVGSITRNKHIGCKELRMVLSELHRRVNDGFPNYMGSKYGELLRNLKNRRK